MNQKKNVGKKIELNVIYKYKNIIIDKITLDLYKSTFGDIVDYFKNNNKKKYSQFILKSKYFFNGKELEQSNIISNLLISQNIELEQIKELNFEIFLDEIYNIYDKDLDNYKKIIIPNISKNSFELYIYFPSQGFIDIEEYDDKIFKEYSLNKINSKTSFCNNNKFLFLSGGDYHDVMIDNFWIINNEIYSITTNKLPSPKSNHSMLPIDDNNIIIIGGNDTKTFLFNVNKNKFSTLENTNNIHYKPTLVLFKNYIYCFSEQNNSINAEKILFSDKNNKWENISLKFINENELLDGGTKFKSNTNENILIIFENKKMFFYNPLNNNIKKINNENFNYEYEICQNDKNIYKISKYYSACIPDNFIKEKYLIILNKKKRIFHKMNFLPSDDSLKIKHQFEESEKIDNENNIIIKVEFANFLDFDSMPFDKFDEILDEKNNYDDTDDNLMGFKKVSKILKSENEITEEKLDNKNEKEILRENYSFNDNKENNDFKSHSSKSGLLIPNNIAYERLIQRTSDITQNEEDLININDNSNDINDNKEKILIPKKHNLSSSLKMNDNDNNNNNQNLIYDKLTVENKNAEDNKEKVIKGKINLLLSKDSLEEHLINREIINELEVKNLNDDGKKDTIINPVKRKLENMELKEENVANDNDIDNENSDKMDDVFSFDAFEYNGNDNKEGDEMKISNIFKKSINLLVSKNSLEDQILDRKIDLEGENNGKDKKNE